jgi:hypothetical protein
MTTIKVTSKLVIELGREGTASHCATSAVALAGMFSNAVQETGEEDSSGTVTVVTPRRIYVYHHPSKFPAAVQEVNAHASAELVC